MEKKTKTKTKIRMTRKHESYLNVVLGILIMVFAVYIGSVLGKKAQVDFTEERLYSLSDGSKAILKKLNTPLVMKLYYSKTAANKGTEGIRAFSNYYKYVRDFLGEYVSYSRNNLRLEVIDPRPDTVEEEDAIRSGLKRFPLTETEKYFFGLVVRSETGAEKVIEFFDPNKQENLEYDLTKLVYSATDPNKKTVGILSSLPVMTDEISPYMAQMMRMQGKPVAEPWIIVNMMKEFYQLKKIEQDVEKISAVDILLIIHPKNFSEKLSFAVEQFILEGGKAILLMDPMSLAEPPNPMMGRAPDTSSDMPKFLQMIGLEFKKNTFAGDKQLAGFGKTSQFAPPSKLLPLINCDKRCTAVSKEAITAGLNNMMFLYPGVLTLAQDKKDSKDMEFRPLISTTEKGNSYSAEAHELNNPAILLNKFRQGDKPVVMAWLVHGKFKSSFPNGVKFADNVSADKTKDQKGKKKKAKSKVITGLLESQKKSSVVVFSDVDFITDRTAFRKTIFGVSVANDNATLFLNTLENLSGSVDLMSVRSKGRFNRSFDVIDNIEENAKKNTARKVGQINSRILNFTKELQELGRSGGNVALVQNEGLKKKRQLSKRIAVLKGELRKVKRVGREKVEDIGKFFQALNTILIPVIIMIIGLVLNFSNRRKRKCKGI